MPRRRTLHLVSLGCPKNRLDSEVMLALSESAGFVHTMDPAEAEVIVINTCGFIQAAKEESVGVILELARYKEIGCCQKLVVTGCLSQRYPKELGTELPEVDHFLGTSDITLLARVLTGPAERIQVGRPGRWIMSAKTPRRRTTPGATAFVKLSEGCNRRCSFCAIPLVRGRQKSRSLEDIVREVQRLAARGVREINLVSQDSTAYGRDRTDGATLAKLVTRLGEVAGIHWIRIHYIYPEKIDPCLVELWARHPRVLPYVDVPFQHVADAMLKRMRRGHSGRAVRQLVDRLRAQVPDAILRTAFIVGHPGESEQEYQELYAFVQESEFDRMGVFVYSDEAETSAARITPKISRRVAERRARALMALGRKVLARKNRDLVGRELEVLVEGPSEESEWVMAGRHWGQAPEIDGGVVLSGGEARPGELLIARVVAASGSDLLAEIPGPDLVELGSSSRRRRG